MLRLNGEPVHLCDGLSRRSFMQIGGLAMGGLALPEILQAQQQNGESSQHKAVIMVFLAGGPPHQDMFDLKPEAPAEVRGEFDPIATNVPGIQISELMPRVAGMMDKFAIIRSLVGAEGRHDAFECCTGHHFRGKQPQGGWPAMGASLSKLYGAVDPSVPPYIDLSHKMAHNPWNIYHHTLKKAGFGTIVPYFSTLEVENARAYQVLREHWLSQGVPALGLQVSSSSSISTENGVALKSP